MWDIVWKIVIDQLSFEAQKWASAARFLWFYGYDEIRRFVLYHVRL